LAKLLRVIQDSKLKIENAGFEFYDDLKIRLGLDSGGDSGEIVLDFLKLNNNHEFIHEYGHVLLERNYNLTKTTEFRELFGDVNADYIGYLPHFKHALRKIMARIYRRKINEENHVSEYAQIHAMEGFAESFVFYVENFASLENFKNRGFYKKLEFMEKLKPQKTINKEIVCQTQNIEETSLQTRSL
jgi:hypothetical protein